MSFSTDSLFPYPYCIRDNAVLPSDFDGVLAEFPLSVLTSLFYSAKKWKVTAALAFASSYSGGGTGLTDDGSVTGEIVYTQPDNGDVGGGLYAPINRLCQVPIPNGYLVGVSDGGLFTNAGTFQFSGGDPQSYSNDFPGYDWFFPNILNTALDEDGQPAPPSLMDSYFATYDKGAGKLYSSIGTINDVGMGMGNSFASPFLFVGSSTADNRLSYGPAALASATVVLTSSGRFPDITIPTYVRQEKPSPGVSLSATISGTITFDFLEFYTP